MRPWTVLNERKRNRGRRFLEECRTSDGVFSGHGDQLVYIGLDGSPWDYPAPLSGLYGINRSRFDIEMDGETHRFGELESMRQHYYRGMSLVEIKYDAGGYTVHQYDLALGRAHVTHVELRGMIPTNVRPTVLLTLTSEGRETWVGQLIHEAGGPSGIQMVKMFH